MKVLLTYPFDNFGSSYNTAKGKSVFLLKMLNNSSIEVCFEGCNDEIKGLMADLCILDDCNDCYWMKPLPEPAPFRNYGPARKGKKGKLKKW